MDSLKNSGNDVRGSEDEFWPLSGKPNFNMIVKKTQLKPQYILYVPAKLSDSLPTHDVPVVFTYGGKKWETRSYVYRRGNTWRTSIKWREFVIDNNLNEGDACVFEFTESNNKLIRVKVQILRGDFPSQLLPRTDGQSADKPIVL
ncbi:putative transcription factor B3-Domain family [Heracleum sosnowskyi]|uniref:Transcription factor B3-Domain family n=1 Tax=Heracleum sosnowskyi TaxID=360622 RepID=A0AAD8N996_9APIA|nr:putative transcription factor B3-Domain family [Heracleum sosnowskyi]